ncbi:MAG: acyltransferase, partial [Kyrpidia sp.]|nr:acyltransferase [Kyrpidia sp.]
GRTVEPGLFWSRRAQSVVIPYLVWSLIYLTVMPALGAEAGVDVHDPRAVLEALVTGSAMYHLYYIVLTLQFYLLFPWWIRWFQGMAPARRWGWTIALALADLIILYADFRWTLHYTSSSKWFLYRDRFLPYYFIYFLFGSTLAAAVVQSGWSRRLARTSVWLGWLAAGAAALYVGIVFALRMRAGWSYASAVSVMQPSYAFYGIAVSLALYVTGRWKREHGNEQDWIHALGRYSFGIYLSHPLILFLLEQNLFASSSHRLWWAETAVLWTLTLALSWMMMAWADRVPVVGWLLGTGQRAPWHRRSVHTGRFLSS